jgi:HEAT repeat protein
MPSRRFHRRTKAERLAARGDVRRLVRLLRHRDWLVDADGHARDLAAPRRLEAVAALATVDSEAAEDGLVLALDDDDPRVCEAAAVALGVDASPRAAHALARAAATWREPGRARARAAALDVLVGMNDEVLGVVFAEALLEDEELDELRPDDERALRRLFAARGHATDVLAERLALQLDEPDEAFARRTHQVLVALGSSAVRSLVDALADPDRSEAACAALAAIRDVGAVPALVWLLGNGKPTGRAAAARALGAIRDPGAVDALVSASKDPDPDVRDAALDALDRLGTVVDLLGAAALASSFERRPDEEDDEPRPANENGTGRSPHDAPVHPTARTLLDRLLGKPPH